MARIDSFLRLVAEQRASDLHFGAGNIPMVRHDGDLVPLPFRALSETEAERFLLEIMSPDQRRVLKEEQQVDFVYALEGYGRYRANAFRHSKGLGAVFRIIPDRIPSMEDLKLPASLKKLTEMANGLVLVTGPTGSGKSTTLAALVAEINRTSNRHIITIEDPVEFLHEPINCVVTQRQVGLHAESFAAALRSALRESPDVLVVGEMRDMETISLALSAAETGVLVFGTLHTNSAPKAVDRILDSYPEESRDPVRGVLSVLLKGAIAQHLIRVSSGDGRLGVFEVMLHDYAVANLIRENKLHQIDGYLASAENANTGVQSLDGHLIRLLRQGLVTLDDALLVANHPDRIRKAAAELQEE